MWDGQVPGCFGAEDFIFAGHSAEKEQAFEWMTDLRTRGVGWQDAKRQLEDYLKDRGVLAPHMASQISEAAKKLRPWLLD